MKLVYIYMYLEYKYVYCIYLRMYICMSLYIYTSKYVYIFIYIYTSMYIYMYIHLISCIMYTYRIYYNIHIRLFSQGHSQNLSQFFKLPLWGFSGHCVSWQDPQMMKF